MGGIDRRRRGGCSTRLPSPACAGPVVGAKAADPGGPSAERHWGRPAPRLWPRPRSDRRGRPQPASSPQAGAAHHQAARGEPWRRQRETVWRPLRRCQQERQPSCAPGRLVSRAEGCVPCRLERHCELSHIGKASAPTPPRAPRQSCCHREDCVLLMPRSEREFGRYRRATGPLRGILITGRRPSLLHAGQQLPAAALRPQPDLARLPLGLRVVLLTNVTAAGTGQ